MSLETLQRAVQAAEKAGAHSADAVTITSDSTEVRVRGDDIEHVKQARERTLGLRVFMKHDGGLSQAVTSTSDLSNDAIDRLAADSVALAKATAADPDAGLPSNGFATDRPDLALVHPGDRDGALDRHIEAGRQAERAARSVDPRIVNSEGTDAGSEFREVYYANSQGFAGSYESASHSLVCVPIAAENGAMQTDHWYTVSRSLNDLDDPETVGRKAANRALGQLGARKVATGEFPVVFDGPTARTLLSSLVGCLSGYAIYRQSSFLAGRLGDRIASDHITVVDDGRKIGGLGSKPFDGEGQPTRRKVLVEKGQLRSYLLDTYSARKLDLETTGNASRGAGSAPGVGSTNLWLEPGRGSLDDLVADTGTGLLVTGMFGHGFNPVTGDFSRGAKGFWIDDGKAAFPVEEITIAGNLGDMLSDVDAVGEELLWLGSVAAPPLRIARMTVAGE